MSGAPLVCDEKGVGGIHRLLVEGPGEAVRREGGGQDPLAGVGIFGTGLGGVT